MKSLLVVGLGLSLVAFASAAVAGPPGLSDRLAGDLTRIPQYTGSAPNVVVVLTDDMPEGVVHEMRIISSQIRDKGILFGNGVIPTPLCCPSRSSLFTGNYAHRTGFYTNFGGLTT